MTDEPDHVEWVKKLKEQIRKDAKEARELLEKELEEKKRNHRKRGH